MKILKRLLSFILFVLAIIIIATWPVIWVVYYACTGKDLDESNFWKKIII